MIPGEGSGDRRVQAYCLRMCLPDHPDNRIPVAKPKDYDQNGHARNEGAGEISSFGLR